MLFPVLIACGERVRKCFWTGFSSGLLSGGFAGGTEAIVTLAGVDVGEYDAIFWGVIAYSFLGIILGGVVGCVLVALHRWIDLSTPFVWSASFCTLAALQLVWTLAPFNTQILCLATCLGVGSLWLMTIFLRRTPLKILPTPRGTLVMWGFCVLLSGIFSLTPGQRIELPPSKEAADGRNVLILVVDGLRSDHIGIGRTHAIDRLASESVYFSKATTNSPRPLLAAAAIFGGEPISTKGTRLSRTQNTLAQKASEKGYHTAAFVNHQSLGRYSNFHLGFDTFQYLPPRSPLPLTEGARRLRLIRNLLEFWGRSGVDSERHYRRADEIVVGVRQFISEHQNEPWFVVAHLRETATPFYGDSNRPIWPNIASPKAIETAYRQELRRMDEPLGRLLQWVSDQPFSDNTIVALISTNGADFERAPHGPSPYQSQVHVPLAIKAPGLSPRKIDSVVQLSDMPRTIASLIPLEPDPSWVGADVLSVDGDRIALDKRPARSSFYDRHRQWSTIQVNQWKLVRGHSAEGPIKELYNLNKDPYERENRYQFNQFQRERLQNLMDASEGP